MLNELTRWQADRRRLPFQQTRRAGINHLANLAGGIQRVSSFSKPGERDASAQADLAAKAGTKGGAFAGAIDVAPGIKLYQITENGLALQATIQGTKYWRDGDLNSLSAKRF